MFQLVAFSARVALRVKAGRDVDFRNDDQGQDKVCTLSDLEEPSLPSVNGHWTPARRELLNWLTHNAPSLAELYQGSVELMYATPLPGRIRFVSHAVREIRNRLPDAVSGVKSSGTLQYKNRVGEIARKWRKAGLKPPDPAGRHGGSAKSAASTSDHVPVPRRVFLIIHELVGDHESTHEKPAEAAIRFFEHCAPENRALRNTLRPLALRWLDITDWFEKKRHDSGMLDAELASDEEFRNKFELFEATLSALVRSFFSTIAGLDEILEDTNS